MRLDRDTLSTIEQAVLKSEPSAGGWRRASCPVCTLQTGKTDHKLSLGFRPDNNVFHCFRCGVKGKLHIDVYFDSSFQQQENTDEEKSITLPEGYMKLYKGAAKTAESTKRARDYLLRRNIPLRTWRETDIGVTLEGYYANRIIIPVYTADNALGGWVGRLWRKSKKQIPYRYPMGMHRGDLLWNGRVLQEETDDPAIVVEGVFDGLPHYPHAVACLGKPSKNQFHFFMESKRPVVIALDGDAWIEGEALAMRLAFEGKRAGFIHLPPKSDPGDLEPGKLFEMAKKSLP